MSANGRVAVAGFIQAISTAARQVVVGYYPVWARTVGAISAFDDRDGLCGGFGSRPGSGSPP